MIFLNDKFFRLTCFPFFLCRTKVVFIVFLGAVTWIKYLTHFWSLQVKLDRKNNFFVERQNVHNLEVQTENQKRQLFVSATNVNWIVHEKF